MTPVRTKKVTSRWVALGVFALMLTAPTPALGGKPSGSLTIPAPVVSLETYPTPWLWNGGMPMPEGQALKFSLTKASRDVAYYLKFSSPAAEGVVSRTWYSRCPGDWQHERFHYLNSPGMNVDDAGLVTVNPANGDAPYAYMANGTWTAQIFAYTGKTAAADCESKAKEASALKSAVVTLAVAGCTGVLPSCRVGGP